MGAQYQLGTRPPVSQEVGARGIAETPRGQAPSLPPPACWLDWLHAAQVGKNPRDARRGPILVRAVGNPLRSRPSGGRGPALPEGVSRLQAFRGVRSAAAADPCEASPASLPVSLVWLQVFSLWLLSFEFLLAPRRYDMESERGRPHESEGERWGCLEFSI